MKRIIAAISIAVIAGLGCPALFSAEEENEQTVKMSDLPAAVQTTIKDKAGSNPIKKIEKKTENGGTVYEAVVSKSGKDWSIEVNEQGKFLKEYRESKEKEEHGEKY
jgi:phage pi2 protein 07